MYFEKELIYIIIICFLVIYIIYNNFEKNNFKNNIRNPSIKKENCSDGNILTIDVNKIQRHYFQYVFFQCVDKYIPLKIKNGINYFPQIKKWTEEYVQKKYLDKKLSLNNTIVGLDCKKMKSQAKKFVTKYIDKIEKNNNNDNNIYIDAGPQLYIDKNYLKHTNFNPTTHLLRRELHNKDLEQLRIEKDILPNPLFEKRNIESFMFYNGPKNTGILPHTHSDAINILRKGAKKWVFCLFDERDENDNCRKSVYKAIDIEKKKHNLNDNDYITPLWTNWYKIYKKNFYVRPLECIQESGDVIYVPGHFVHAVYNLDQSEGLVINIKRDINIENENPTETNKNN